MQFAQPLWIVTGLSVCTLLALLLYRLEKQKKKKIEVFAGTQLGTRLTRNLSSPFRIAKGILLLAALMMLFVALARPQYGFRWVEVKRKGIDILFALDTSRSMLVSDLKPNRLERARLGILDFISGLEGDRIGLMPFAGATFLMTPLTLDYTAFETSLASVDTDIIPVAGTNITRLIGEAETILSNDANHKILILMTDGENLEGDAVEAARAAAAKGVTIHTVGIGTTEGELVPLPTSEGSGFIKNREGHYVTSRLDESTLKEIADATGGVYAQLGKNGEGLQRIYREKLALIPKEELAERKQRVPVERFGYPLAAALVLLVIEWLLPQSRKPNPLSFTAITSKSRRIRKVLILCFCLSALFGYSAPLQASEAEEAYEAENYLKASELYSHMLENDKDNPKLHYNFGATAYKNNMFDDAIASFSQALQSDDLGLQEKAYYNRGNAYYKKGEESVQANPQTTIEQWKQAISSYEGALSLNKEDRLARDNLQFVQTKLEELEKQMQNQQNKEDNGESSEQDNKDTSKKDQDDQKQPDGENSGNQDRQDEERNQQQQSGESGSSSPDNNETHEQDSQKQEEQNNNSVKPDPQKQAKQPESNPPGTANPDQDNDDQKTAGAAATPEKMSQEEAENLLNLMKNSEGELNFLPRFEQPETSGRDW